MRVLSLLAVAVTFALILIEPAFAEAAAEATGGSWVNPLTAGFALAIAAFGGALGQSKIIAAALESISRNPGASGQMFLPWFLGIVFVESLVVYVLVIALIKI
jgi:F-type H+-transporting ATPase subunit c